MTKAIIKRL